MKWLYNLLDRLQQRRSRWFDLVVFCNEIYIRFYFIVTGRRWRMKPINEGFIVRGERFWLRTIDSTWLDRLVEFFEGECTPEQKKTFNPHPLDYRGMKKVFRRWHYITLGIFSEKDLVGYCVIRPFFPNKGLYAIIVGQRWRNRGIGAGALRIEVEYIAKIGLKPMSAVRNTNLPSIRILSKAGIRFGEDCGKMTVTLEATEKQNTEDRNQKPE